MSEYDFEERFLGATMNSSDTLDDEASTTSGSNYDSGTSSVDRATNILGPLPDLYQINTTAVSVGFLILAAVLVLLMQLGLTQLEAGLSRATNAQHVYMKNQLSLAVSALCFYFVGFGLAFGEGEGSNAFSGSEAFALHNIKRAYMWFAQFAFAINASSVWHGAVTGRMRFMAYLWITAIMTSIVYPIAAHWVWSPEGWLYNIGESGVIDFSGGGPVHVIGGMTGLIGAWMIGPRLTTLTDKGSKFASAHNKPLAAAGTTLLFIGWIAYTTVTSASVSMYYQAEVAGRVATVTVLAASAALMVSFAARRVFIGSYDLIWLNNSMVAGLVSVTGPCACISTWAAIIIGSIGAALHAGAAEIFRRFGIDDPLDSVSIHLVCGSWGLIAAGLFADPTFLAQTKGLTVDQVHVYGLLYGGSAICLGQQVLAIVAMMAWSFVTMMIVFGALRFTSRLRISKEAELGGVDLFKHSSLAYPDFALGMEEIGRIRNYDYSKDSQRTMGPNQLMNLSDAGGVGFDGLNSNHNNHHQLSGYYQYSPSGVYVTSQSSQNNLRSRSSILHPRRFQRGENHSVSVGENLQHPTTEAEGITSLSFDDDDTNINNNNNKTDEGDAPMIIAKAINSSPVDEASIKLNSTNSKRITLWNTFQGLVNANSTNNVQSSGRNKAGTSTKPKPTGTVTDIATKNIPTSKNKDTNTTVASENIDTVIKESVDHPVKNAIHATANKDNTPHPPPVQSSSKNNNNPLPVLTQSTGTVNQNLPVVRPRVMQIDDGVEEPDYRAQFYDWEGENRDYDDNIEVDEDLDWHTSVSAHLDKEKHGRQRHHHHHRSSSVSHQRYGWNGERKSAIEEYNDDQYNDSPYSNDNTNGNHIYGNHPYHGMNMGAPTPNNYYPRSYPNYPPMYPNDGSIPYENSYPHNPLAYGYDSNRSHHSATIGNHGYATQPPLMESSMVMNNNSNHNNNNPYNQYQLQQQLLILLQQQQQQQRQLHRDSDAAVPLARQQVYSSPTFGSNGNDSSPPVHTWDTKHSNKNFSTVSTPSPAILQNLHQQQLLLQYRQRQQQQQQQRQLPSNPSEGFSPIIPTTTAQVPSSENIVSSLPFPSPVLANSYTDMENNQHLSGSRTMDSSAPVLPIITNTKEFLDAPDIGVADLEGPPKVTDPPSHGFSSHKNSNGDNVPYVFADPSTNVNEITSLPIIDTTDTIVSPERKTGNSTHNTPVLHEIVATEDNEGTQHN